MMYQTVLIEDITTENVTEIIYVFLTIFLYLLIKCTLCQGHYDFFLFRFLLYICLLCRGIKVMPLIDCFHLLL